MNYKNNKRFLAIAVLTIFVILALTPIVNSVSIKQNNTKKSEECTLCGSIFGNCGEKYIWGFSPVRFAKISAGGKTTFSGPIMGEYKIKRLPLGTYEIIGSKKGYETYRTNVTLTEKHPDKQVFIDLKPEDVSVKNIESESLNIGFIHGQTMWAKGWRCGTLRFTKIVAKAENYSRVKISGFFGKYFLFVPLNVEISITASKIGHETETRKVTLTNENKIEYVGFMLNVL